MKGIYIHIPFCVKKCEYCDFVSFPGMEKMFDAYLAVLSSEMEKYRGEKADTVFIGGGTPTVLDKDRLGRLLRKVNDNFSVSSDAEFTIEANPGTLNDDKISELLAGGVNRVSVGVQSFNDAELMAIGRIHDSKTAYETVKKLHGAGFSNISIDLMGSLPYQTDDSFRRSLETAMDLPIKHISVYSLIIEEGTPIKKKYDEGIYDLPDEDTDRDMYHYTRKYLESKGFKRYEISNYALPGYESMHNLKYWDCDEYIGIGLAAHSYFGGVRYKNTSELDRYISGEFRESCEMLTEDDMRGEFMMLGLRKTGGVSAEKFKDRFGDDIDAVYGKTIDKFVKMGLLDRTGGYIRLTERGLDVSNAVMCEFL